MRAVRIAVGVLVVGIVIAFSGAHAADTPNAGVPGLCPAPQVSPNQGSEPFLNDLPVKPKQASYCWQILCTRGSDCAGDPCTIAYCDFRFGFYGYCQEW